MSDASIDLSRWSSIADHIAAVLDLEASAREHGALLRRRGIRSARDLLQLVMLYGPGGLSLRALASHATLAGIADVCDVSLLDRLRNSVPWLEAILNALLEHKRAQRPALERYRLAIFDGSMVSSPGAKGSQWRLHARYEPQSGGFTDLHISDVHEAESLSAVIVEAGDVVLHDRGYARVRNLAHAAAQGAHFLTRIGWQSLQLTDAAGALFDLITALPQTGPEVVEYAVHVRKGAIPARLIIMRKSEEAAEHERKRIRRKARGKARIDPRSLLCAGYLMFVTSLPADEVDAAEILELYRMRWQIELAFKRLKSLGDFDKLRASDPRLVRCWLLAHLIATVLIETSLSEELDAPP